jgi:CRP/FNR family transcriptional regulator
LRDRDRDGQEIVVGFAAEGEMFGHEVLADLPQRVFAATAAEASEVLSVNGAQLKELAEREPSFNQHFVRYLAASALHDREQIKMLAFLDVPTRLAGTILWLSDRYGRSKNGELEVPYWFTHQEMADIIGSTRETVTTVLAEFKRQNLIISRNHHFIVLDRGRLSERIRLPDFAAE